MRTHSSTPIARWWSPAADDAIVIDVVRDGKIVEHTIVGDLGTFMAGFDS